MSQALPKAKPRRRDRISSTGPAPHEMTDMQAGSITAEKLRAGAVQALRELGSGFIENPRNSALRAALSSGSLPVESFHRQVLGFVCRLLLLFYAEDRGLLHSPGSTGEARRSYATQNSLGRIRDLAQGIGIHGDSGALWSSLKATFRALDHGEPASGLPALGGLFDQGLCADLDSSALSDRRLCNAVRAIAFTASRKSLELIDYRTLRVEEIGSAYEALLELHPVVQASVPPWAFGFAEEAGRPGPRRSERKLSGSYYTPDSLVQELLRSALDPVIERTVADNPAGPREALLRLRVLDPACGSGHFLLGAARRLADAVARFEQSGKSPEERRRNALREVVRRCIHGVDLNPLTVELCKSVLSLEVMDPGQPPPCLDAQIRCGDSLVGVADLGVLQTGIPDAAYRALPGDDKALCAGLRNRNEAERDSGSHRLGPSAGVNARMACDLWCAAFLLPKTSQTEADLIPTTAMLRRVLRSSSGVPDAVARAASDVAGEMRFFHWPLEFPEVIARGGFDCVLGNPPYLFLSGKGSPAKALEREGRMAQAARLKRRIHFCGSVFARTSSGCQDYFKWFTELSTILAAKPASRMGLVLPNTWLSLPRYSDLRGLLVRRGLSHVVDFGFGAFPALAVGTCAVTAGGERPSRSILYADLKDDMSPFLAPDELRALIGERAVGIAPSRAGFSIYRNVLAQPFFEGADHFLRDLCVITEGEHHLDPHDVTADEEPAVLVLKDWELARFRTPGSQRVRMRRAASARAHSGPRLIVRKTGDQIVSAVVASDTMAVTHQNAYVVRPRDGIPVHAVQAILASKMASFLYRASPLGQKGRPMAQLRVGGLASLPLPNLDGLRLNSSLLAEVSQVLHRERSDEAWDRLNDLVFEMYGVDRETRAAVEDFCSDVSL
jgi:hypothetical protein